jgi:CRP/FNR family transcriptional regulator, cyclic AMP receptor protein
MRGPSTTVRAGGSLLSGFDLFKSLSDDALRAIERACTSRRYAREEQIIDRDSRSRDVVCVISGRAKVLNYSVSGREIILDDLVPGSSFGEIGAIDDQPRLAEVVATADVVVVVIPQIVFIGALNSHPQVAVALMRRFARTIREADERIMDLSTLAAHDRVYAEVLRRAHARMIGDNTAEIVPPPLHSEIAGKTSTSRETVARAISDLTRRGIVSRAKTGLCVNDVYALRQIVARVRA